MEAAELRAAVQDEGAPKNYSECISYEHVIQSVIQNPKALSSKILERGGDEMGMYVCVRRGGGCTVSPVHILVLGWWRGWGLSLQ